MRERSWTKLHVAAGAGDLEAVDVLLRGGADPAAPAGFEEEAGRTPLHCAVAPWMGQADDEARAAVVARLLAAGAPVDTADAEELTPLMMAASAGLVRCCGHLLDHGAALAAVDRDLGWTALHRTRSPAVAALLLERGADPDAPTRATFRVTRGPGGAQLVYPVGSTAADLAAIDGRPAIVALLAQHGGRRVTTADRTEAQLAYVQALARDDVAAICGLVAEHGIAAILSPGQAPPLHAAIAAGNRELARALLDAGHPLEARDAHGHTPFLAAFHHLDLAHELIARGADLSARDAAGATALHLTRDPAMIERLAGAGLDVDAGDDRGRRPLHRACFDADAVRALLAAGAAVNAADDAGRTPLGALLDEHLGHFALAKLLALLLAAGASPDAMVPAGPRGLPHPAPLVLLQTWIERKEPPYLDAFAVLVRGGADPNLPDPSGWTAMHEATFRRLPDAIAILRAAGARIDLPTTRRVRHYRPGTTAAAVARDRGVSG